MRLLHPLVSKIIAQSHETPDDADVRGLTYSVRREKDDDIKEKLEQLKTSLPRRTRRAVDLACENGASSWLTAIPLKDMNFDLSKREFRDALRLRYDWAIPDSPSVCVCDCDFNADHAMICQRGGLIIQHHNEIRDLEAELLDMVCHDVAVEPTLQPLTGEELNRGANTALADFGRDNGPPFSIYGYVTQMRTRTEILAQTKPTNGTKTKRSENMRSGF